MGSGAFTLRVSDNAGQLERAPITGAGSHPIPPSEEEEEEEETTIDFPQTIFEGLLSEENRKKKDLFIDWKTFSFPQKHFTLYNFWPMFFFTGRFALYGDCPRFNIGKRKKKNPHLWMMNLRSFGADRIVEVDLGLY